MSSAVASGGARPRPRTTTTHTPQALRLAPGPAGLASLPAALRTAAEVVRLGAAK